MTPAATRPRPPVPETKLLADPGLLESGAGEFEGYASLFGVPDLGRDVVAPGAFSESLARRGPDGVRLLWQHDPAQPIGRWLAIAEDRLGLRVRGRLNFGVAWAREIASLLAEGAIDGLSIGFRAVEAERDRRTGMRRLLRVDLWEISIVTFPMLPGARVAAARPVDVKRREAPAGPALSSAIHRAARRLSIPARPMAATTRTR